MGLPQSMHDNDHIRVQVVHRSKGALDISEFLNVQHGFEAFFPWLAVTTWTWSCRTQRRLVELLRQVEVIQNELA
jgi:hypothetical protein